MNDSLSTIYLLLDDDSSEETYEKLFYIRYLFYENLL